MSKSPQRSHGKAVAPVPVQTRSIVHRDPCNGRVMHIRVLAVCGGPFSPDQRDYGQIRPIDLPSCSNDFTGLPLYESETLVAFAHFVLIRCDLSTSGGEMKAALAKTAKSLDDHGSKTERTLRYLIDEIDEAALEDSMEAADDRWVDQLSIVDCFRCTPDLQPSDLYGACLRALLAFTNASSGMVVAVEYIHDKDKALPRDVLECAMAAFENREDTLRVVIHAYHHAQKPNAFWLVSGVAQSEMSVESSTRVRLASDTLVSG